MDDVLATIITQLPNVAGLLVGIMILWRIVTIQHTTINRLVEAIIKRENCEDEPNS